MLNTVNGFLTQIGSILLIVSLIFYLLQTFFGYKLFKISCAIVGFFIGLIAGIGISGSVFHLSGAWPPIIGVIAGVLLGFLAFKLFLFGLFILVFLVTFGLATKIPLPDLQIPWKIAALAVAVAIAIIAGFLAVRFQKIVLIVFTSVAGAFNSVLVFNKITAILTQSPYNYWIVAAALAVIGLLVQFLTNKSY